MVLISRRVDYAILVLVELAAREGLGASARELADRFGLSRPFVANILKALCQAGFIDSQRGIHGGYRLVRSACEITLREIIAALDGPFELMSCIGGADRGSVVGSSRRPNGSSRRTNGDREEDPACSLIDICPVRGPLQRVHDRLLAILGEVTLEELRAGHEPALVHLETELANAVATHLPG